VMIIRKGWLQQQNFMFMILVLGVSE
jgi:hypothetical protein